VLNYFNENILPLSEELQEMLDAQELLDDKMRAQAVIEADEAAAEKEESLDCE